MMRWGWRGVLRIALASSVVLAVVAAQDTKPDLKEFKTVETAQTTKARGLAPRAGSPGYLGVAVAVEGGKLVVTDVADASPAAKAGVQARDVLLKVDGKAVSTAEAFRDLLQARGAGEAVKLTVQRNKETQELTASATLTSKLGGSVPKRAVLGIRADEDKNGAKLTDVTAKLPADRAGLKVGDIVIKVDGKALDETTRLTTLLADQTPGATLTLLVKPQGKEPAKDVKVTLVAAEEENRPGRRPGGGFGWDTRNAGVFKKELYKLAVIRVEYPDVKMNEKIAAKNWEDALFSCKTYTETSVTGQKVHGSMNDYYLEQSFGKLKVEGKCFAPVAVSKKRLEYAASNTGPSKSALLTEALDVLVKRDGKDVLKGYDGIFFLHAGDRVNTNRGGIYWPHKSSITHQGNRLNYFIVPEGSGKMSDISVICHEFGHMLGLPDLYARPENPGSEGVGVWCAMSNQAGGGKPQHFSAWSKEQLGWVAPATIDPTVKQKLILAPIEDSPKECFKVLARPDGSEYFLLENRKKKGYDASLPAEGLLIWRVVQNRPILEEAHGVDGPSGPRVFLDAVPFPSTQNHSFTPFTTPSSRAQLGGGSPVHITNIRRLPDGRITFYVGYEFY